MIARIVLSDAPNLAKLHELESIYNTVAVYNFIELLEFKSEMEELSKQDLEVKREQFKQEQAAKNRRGKR